MGQKIAIVGCGFSGLIWAARALKQGHDVRVFEKRSTIGGVWETIANSTSRVQMVEHDYRFETEPDEGFEPPVHFTPRDAMLAQAQHFFKKHRLEGRVCFGTEVRSIRDRGEGQGYAVKVRHDGQEREELFDAVAVLPGTLYKANTLAIEGEETFGGPVVKGIGDDLPPQAYAGKRVVVVGMGSYAIENARTALEQGAEHVTVVARSYNVVVPQFMSYQVTSHLNWKGDQITDLLRDAYDLVGRPELTEKFQNGTTHAQQVIPPISDVYFIALKYGRLEVIKDQLASMGPGSVRLQSGKTLEADVVVKCIGFDRHETHRRMKGMLGDFELNGVFVNRRNTLAFNFEPRHGGFSVAEGIPLASHLTITSLFADIFLYYLDRPQKFEAIASRLPSVRSAAEFSGGDHKALIRLLHGAEPDVKDILLYHLAAKTERCRKRGSERDFVEENRREWARYCQMLGRGQAPFPYPFKSQTRLRTRLMNQVLFRYARYRYRRVFKGERRVQSGAGEPVVQVRQAV